MQAAPTPRIINRTEHVISPWVRIVERLVDFRDGRVDTYHAIAQADYVGILAVTPDRLIPIVRQYRPALERYSWEFPAGLVEPGESAETTCERELLEETGLVAKRIHKLGTFAADSARLGNQIHSFLVETEARGGAFEAEQGIEVSYLELRQLEGMILSGDFDLQYHIGVLGLALLHAEMACLLRKVMQNVG